MSKLAGYTRRLTKIRAKALRDEASGLPPTLYRSNPNMRSRNLSVRERRRMDDSWRRWNVSRPGSPGE